MDKMLLYTEQLNVGERAGGALGHSRRDPCVITLRIKMKICDSSDFQISPPFPEHDSEIQYFSLSPSSILNCQLIVLSVLRKPTPQHQPLAPIYIRI